MKLEIILINERRQSEKVTLYGFHVYEIFRTDRSIKIKEDK
jgi:hypothetical protein